MSACDTCRQPGACCNDIFISGAWNGYVYEADWPGEAVARLDELLPGHPFIPLRLELLPPESMDESATGPYGGARWACKNLTPEGRCGDYENRPNLCRAYQPMQDRLCVEFIPITVVS